MKNYINSKLQIKFPEAKLILSADPFFHDIATTKIMNGLTLNFTLEHYRHMRFIGSPLRK